MAHQYGQCYSRVSGIHPSELRKYSVGEMREFLGLPHDHILVGPLGEKIKQIGNGVAVPVAKALGESIIKAIQNSEIAPAVMLANAA